MTYEEIKKANEKLKPVDIKGKNYIDVAQRIQAFRSVIPNGAIVSEIISLEDGVVTMKATVFDDAGRTLATGHAQEKETSSYINKTSYIENCETSAVGRALGMCGFGSENSIASLEEVANAINNQGKAKADTKFDEAFDKALERGAADSLTYEDALMVIVDGKTLKDIYKTERASVKTIYENGDDKTRKAIELINEKIKESKK